MTLNLAQLSFLTKIRVWELGRSILCINNQERRMAPVDSIHHFPVRALVAPSAMASVYWLWLARSTGYLVSVVDRGDRVLIRLLGVTAIELEPLDEGCFALRSRSVGVPPHEPEAPKGQGGAPGPELDRSTKG